jgi:ligand-binding sensor protein
LEGNILTATAWQDVCTKFHRLNLSVATRCNESDTRIKVNVGDCASPVIYKCPLGMTDSAMPIIVEDQHIGNVFIGQLFMEQPEEGYFIEQACQYGFDENAYLEAVRKVPLCTEEQILINLKFISNFVQVLAEQGLTQKRQFESERLLQESEKKLKVIFDSSVAGIMVVSPLGIITFANRRMAEMFGVTLNTLDIMSVSR